MPDPQTSETAITIKDLLPLIGVALGGAFGFFSNAFMERQRGKKESRRLAYAFKAEIKALEEVGDRRGYIYNLKKIADTVKDSGRPNDGSNVLSIRDGREFFPIYNNNLAKIGTLKNPLPEKIVQYYAQATSVIEEIRSVSSDERWHNVSDDILSSQLQGIVVLMENTRSLGAEIVTNIDRLYR
jgi:hypothetical protein